MTTDSLVISHWINGPAREAAPQAEPQSNLKEYIFLHPVSDRETASQRQHGGFIHLLTARSGPAQPTSGSNIWFPYPPQQLPHSCHFNLEFANTLYLSRTQSIAVTAAGEGAVRTAAVPALRIYAGPASCFFS